MAEALKQNVPDEKMQRVQRLLNEGKSKFETARAVGYQTVDGLDKFAKNVGYVWNVGTKNYELKDVVRGDVLDNPPARMKKILSMVEKGIDLNDIAKYFRMKNARELAEYMATRGYAWDVDNSNYVKKGVSLVEDEPESDNAGDTGGNGNDVDIMKLLQANKGRLIELLAYKAQKTIPRYVVKGVMVTKSFYLSTEIDRLIKEFSDWKDVPQKDIIHTALIEFFQRYGYHEEARTLLKY